VLTPASIPDLEARFRPLSAAESAVADALLQDAWAIMRAQVPSLESRLLGGSLDLFAVVAVQTAMVLRVLRNPNGVRQWSVDDYSETRDTALSSGALYLDPAEADLLAGRASSSLPRAASVSTAPEVECHPASYRVLW
jgi:hypothetical protein